MPLYRLARATCVALFMLVVANLAHGESYALSTIAGTPSQAFADGVGTAARFAAPQAIAFGSDGNIYVADTHNFVVRKIASDGTVTTLAGLPGVSGYVDGIGPAARFGYIFGIAVDRSGNVYVTGSDTVRRITPAGDVKTFAGSPYQSGSVDAQGMTARFGDTRGLAVDTSGNVYVGDVVNHTIRKITSTGTVTTLAGTSGVAGTADGTGTAAQFETPYGLAVDTSGNVYVADWTASTVRKITAAGVVTTLAGKADTPGTINGAADVARLDSPDAIAVDDGGYLAITDRTSHTLRLISPSGEVYTAAGAAYVRGYRDGVGTAARFDSPTGVTFDPVGYLIVADSYNGTIRRMDSSLNVTTLAGQTGAGTADGLRSAARFFSPEGITIDANQTLYVADTYNHAIRKVAPDGTVTTVAGLGGTQGSLDGAAADARFRYPSGIAVDSGGTLYVADYTNNTIRKITPAGIVGTLAGAAQERGSADGAGNVARFYYPDDVKLDPSGNLVVSDSGNHTIRRVAPNGTVTTIAGQAGVAGSADGTGQQARFNYPHGLAFDRSGNLYIADSGNAVIRKMTPDGKVTTIAGFAGQEGDTDGTGSAARFLGPEGVAVDPEGNVFVGDAGNHLIRKITSDGTVTTIAGSGYIGISDGLGDSSELFYPAGLATDTLGNVYIADEYNHTIRKAGLTGVQVPQSRLLNLSVRANLVADQRLIAGFVVSGTEKPMLVRAIGPGLAPYVGGATTAGNPRIEMYDSAVNLVQSNEDWGGTAELIDAFNRVGAFPLPADSRDAALVRNISGLHSVHVISPASGIGLVEAYDTGDGSVSRLINVSARYRVETGDGALFAGFVIGGSGAKTVLIRGIGPTLTTFGVGDTLTNPRLTLFMQKDGTQQQIAANDDWPASLASTFDRVNAFGLKDRSTDAALLISLPPGLYTAQLTGTDGGTGQGMVEVYEVGN